VSHLTCPTCRFTVSAGVASPLQSCPRCLVRDRVRIELIESDGPPPRFARSGPDLAHISEAKARLTRRTRVPGSSA